MNKNIINNLAHQLNIKTNQIEATIKLLKENNTIPFIARYRKQLTGNLDEQQIFSINKEYEYQLNLQEKKEWIIDAITKKGKITNEIIIQINNCTKLNELENIYKPYAEKKKTRAAIALNLGFGPLADFILTKPRNIDNQVLKYVNQNMTYEDVLNYTKDIIAEIITDDFELRKFCFNSILNYGFIKTKLLDEKKDIDKKYCLYYQTKLKINKLQAFQVMAINRAKKEKVINFSFKFNKDIIKNQYIWKYTKNIKSKACDIIIDAINDGFKRLLIGSVENEIWNQISENAQQKSIDVFAKNLEMILCQPPIKDKNILAIDPGFKTGCKLALVNKNNKMILVDTIYCNDPFNKKTESEQILKKIIDNNQVDLIAIGNGTASRETEIFVNNFLKQNNLNIKHLIASEIGASVYSASENARKEFPDLSVEKRSAISIARRIIDPLAELIKIDPKSIGVGQYQHEVSNTRLSTKLNFIVEMIVNRIGVDINTASVELLTYVSGINKKIANNIIEYRNKNGDFILREQIKNIKSINEKVFEQSSGFLRIVNGKNILDQTSIHPEKYDVANKILNYLKIDLNKDNKNLQITNTQKDYLINKLNLNEFEFDQIINAITENKRDYRDQFDAPILKEDVLDYQDLKIGMELDGVIRNIVDFGIFIDIGIKNDAFLHISNIKKNNNAIDQYEKYYINQILKVKIKNINLETKKVEVDLIN